MPPAHSSSASRKCDLPKHERPGKVTDNAVIESFFHSMKSEVFHGYTFTEDRQVRQTLRRYPAFLQSR
jgi:transposase InsO family protein